MTRFLTALIAIFITMPGIVSAEERQILELRTYELVSSDAEPKLDAYLSEALIPALLRQGLGPIGAFGQSKQTENAIADEACKVMLLVSGPNVDSVTGAEAKLATDAVYQQAASDYLETPADEPLVARIQSELLRSFECWPKVTVPSQAASPQQASAPKQNSEANSRLFELRIYESPTEKRGQLKVEMFNSGEVPIFLDSGVMPVFMGQALIGDKMPNLTYMTVYDNEAARASAWKRFMAHPDWQVLKKVEKYEGTVSKIYKSDWLPKPYSQL